MPTTYPINPPPFDGGKFSTRYSLNSARGDFWAEVLAGQSTLFIKDGITLPDNPPIFDPPDPPEIIKRTDAKTIYDSPIPAGITWRATLLTAVDEINLLRQWLVALKTEIAAATSLADLKTRVATLPNMPDRTPQQARTATHAKMDSGIAD